jgi:ATP-binding cassette, subfamily C (CFTR/MRP), member 1
VEAFSVVDVSKAAEYVGAISEKLRHRGSFAKAIIETPVASRKLSSPGLSKEHLEQGRINIHVYKQYIVAASKAGFFFFLLTTILQQAASVFANLTLRSWGEHNRETGDNSGMLKYLIIYGLFSLFSTILGGVSAILMWVLCALRSARRLHDGVSPCSPCIVFKC